LDNPANLPVQGELFMAQSNQLSVEAPAESGPQAPQRSRENAALARCRRAWQRTFKQQCDDGESESVASNEADKAFVRAMPELCGYQNIQDFIACVAYAIVHKIIYKPDADKFLSVTKVAIAALRHDPKSPPKPGTKSREKISSIPNGGIETPRLPS
jgi:hypothetical protein